MLEILTEMFSYDFIIRAAVTGILISLCASVLGVSLVLGRFSMIGDGLSHVGFGAVAVAVAMNASPLAVSLPVVTASAFLLLRVGKMTTGGIGGDSAVALISVGAVAVGVTAASLSGGIGIDLNAYLFGSILTVTESEAVIGAIIAVAVLTLFALFRAGIFSTTFDPDFAAASGVNIGFCNTLTALMTAAVVVFGMRVAGALLLSGMIVFPALTSLRLCRTFESTVVCSAAVSAICFAVGFTGSLIYGAPVGASVIAANTVAFLIFHAIEALLRR